MSTTSGSMLQIPGSEPPAAQPARAPRTAKAADKHGWWWGTGRRKTAVARVRIKPAEGKDAVVTVEGTNGKIKTVEQYFSEERDRRDAMAAITVSGLQGRVKVVCKCHGGGFMGQAGAIKLALARAVLDYDPQFETQLRENGL